MKCVISGFANLTRLRSQRGKCLNLVKALPHASGKYSETVCCAGVTDDGRWVRQHPVPYRVLSDPQKFKRWDWIEYQYTDPGHDGRKETQRVDPSSIKVIGRSSAARESNSLNSMIVSSTNLAQERGDSLALIRPTDFSISARAKKPDKLRRETEKHKSAADQESLLYNSVKPLIPCPLEFIVNWVDSDGVSHTNVCEDWETSATYHRRIREGSTPDEAVAWIKEKYEVEFRDKGVAFAMGTHALHQKTWLLVGIIRIDTTEQASLI